MARILVVDDDPDVFEIIEMCLGSEGFELSYASSGPAAVAAATADPPDLIVMDARMPNEGDGLEAARTLRAIPTLVRLPILMVSGDEQLFRTMRTRALGAGCNDLILKPFEFADLLGAVRRLLAPAEGS